MSQFAVIAGGPIPYYPFAFYQLVENPPQLLSTI